jgi:acylphosphatase
MATREQAVIHGITGWVRNLGDGRVEVFACGETRQLDDLRRWLDDGPEMACVLNVECDPADYQEFDQFMIR